jgi:hypothetical protein
MPVFTGAELALADTVVLLIDVLMLHGIMKSDAVEAVFDYLENRYRDSGLASSAAMARYLRQHLSHESDDRPRTRLRDLLTEPGEGTC